MRRGWGRGARHVKKLQGVLDDDGEVRHDGTSCLTGCPSHGVSIVSRGGAHDDEGDAMNPNPPWSTPGAREERGWCRVVLCRGGGDRV